VNAYQTGKKGEDKAAAFLKRRGYRVLARNYRVPSGEIDLIVQKGEVLVFVEVKSRRGRQKGSPLESVSPQKVFRVSSAAAAYLSEQHIHQRDCRFDIITLGPDKNILGFLKIRHFPNAFEASGHFLV
jgi:putative endonuclease